MTRFDQQGPVSSTTAQTQSPLPTLGSPDKMLMAP